MNNRDKQKIVDRLKVAHGELSDQMKLKKVQRNNILIQDIQRRIATLKEWLSEKAPKVEIALNPELAKIDADFEKWKIDLREKYLDFIKQVDACTNPEERFAFPIDTSLEIDILFDLLAKKKHLKPQYPLSAPVQVIKYYRNKVHHHERTRNIRQTEIAMHATMAAGTEPASGSDKFPGKSDRGDQSVSETPVSK